MKRGSVTVRDSQRSTISCREYKINHLFLFAFAYFIELMDTRYLHCEPPRSRMVLKRDLKDVYKSGKVISSKVKRSGGSVEEFNETTGATDDGTTHTEG